MPFLPLPSAEPRAGMPLTSIASNECGTCTACCTLMGVPELHKPHQCTCQFSTGTSCTIYTQRPDSCREFACVYREGMFGASTDPEEQEILMRLRPDSIGVMLYVAGTEQPACIAVEVWEGAFQGPAVDLLFRRLTEEGVRVVRRRGRMRLNAIVAASTSS